ncbi:MAG TPA: ATP-binding protein [Flavobacterium sp.]|nr:ATP-binding protein [Flavobacterium sp.]
MKNTEPFLLENSQYLFMDKMDIKHTMFDSLLEGIQIIDFEWRYIYLNDIVSIHAKKPKQLLLGKSMMECYPGIRQTALFKLLQETMNDRKTRRLENEFVYEDGSNRWFNLSIEPVEEGICVLSLDITADKEAIQNMIKTNKDHQVQNREKEKRAAEFVIANKELAFQNAEKEKRAAELIIANKELTFQNTEKEKRAAELIIANKELAFQNKEKEKRASELIIANTELTFQNKEKEKRAAELIIANKELAFQNKEKEKRAAELIVANKELRFQNGEKEKRAAELIVANFELVFQNEEKEKRATELTMANEELIKADLKLEEQNAELVKTNFELDRFVYSVSHDLRSPLTSILGLVSFIEEESDETDTLLHAKMIRNGINRLDGFIKNILSYSRNNRTGIDIKKIALDKTIKEIIYSFHNIKEAESLDFEVEINEGQPFHSDPQTFNTIMENLISNAIKFQKKGGVPSLLKITGKSTAEKLQLTVSDNGIGIANLHHHKIFDMFFRISGKISGTGIGLYIVKESIEKLHGTIEVHSEEGNGTSFFITLKNFAKDLPKLKV